MSRRRRTQKLDANHVEICTEARQRGVDIVELLQPVDCIAHFDGYVSFIEIKVEGQATYTRDQLKFISETRFPVAIVKNTPELMQVMKKRQGLSQMQKDALAGFLALNKGTKWNHQKIERILQS